VDGVDARYRSKLGTVDGDPLATNQTATLRKTDELRARRYHCIAVYPSELSDALMVRIQTSQKPH
jgi:hypothetical protein